MKINFAPADVPLVRRIQTAVVLQWVFSFLALGKCTCFHYFYFEVSLQIELNEIKSQSVFCIRKLFGNTLLEGVCIRLT